MLLEFLGQAKGLIQTWRGAKVGHLWNFNLWIILIFVIIILFLTAEFEVFIDDKVSTELSKLFIVIISEVLDVSFDWTGAIQKGLKVFMLLNNFALHNKRVIMP